MLLFRDDDALNELVVVEPFMHIEMNNGSRFQIVRSSMFAEIKLCCWPGRVGNFAEKTILSVHYVLMMNE